jgi:membrane protein
LRKKDVLLLKGLFSGSPNKANYIETLMRRYGLILRKGEYIFERGNTERNLFYLVEGKVNLSNNGTILREIVAGDYFGELAMLTKQPTTSDAIIASDEARVIVIYAENIDSMLEDDPKIAMQLLRHMAGRLQTNFS